MQSLQLPMNLPIPQCVLHGPAYLILKNIFTLIISGEPYELQSSSSYNFLRPFVISSHFGLNFLLSTLFAYVLPFSVKPRSTSVQNKCKIT
jgi:hypothetical protein